MKQNTLLYKQKLKHLVMQMFENSLMQLKSYVMTKIIRNEKGITKHNKRQNSNYCNIF